jgi:hypothetical protein
MISGLVRLLIQLLREPSDKAGVLRPNTVQQVQQVASSEAHAAIFVTETGQEFRGVIE